MSSNSAILRDHALTIFRAALKAVDPCEAVLRHVEIHGDRMMVAGRRYDLKDFRHICVVGAGKAGAAMVRALEDLLGDRLSSGIVTVKYGHAGPTRLVRLIEAGHPAPDEAGMTGAADIATLLRGLQKDDLVFCVLSGGGSALLPLPVAGITLQEKRKLTDLLLKCGATINEINTLRKHISQVKGGQLARLAYPATVVGLILSDVIGDPLDVIASGPTVPDPSTFDDCLRIVRRYDLMNRIPGAIRTHLVRGSDGLVPDTPGAGDRVFDCVCNVVVASNIQALEAARLMAEELGYRALILSSAIDGETREIARIYAAMAKEIRASGHPLPPPACVISGGETTVTIRGKGKGGRNQEFALSAARGIDGLKDAVVFSAGTDGTDGPTDAAGAMADGETVGRAVAAGLDAEAYLNDNDAYSFFEPLGDLVMTGPTGTNVMDLRLLLVGAAE